MNLPNVSHRKFFPTLITAIGGDRPIAAEVGVYEGKFSRHLLQNTPGLLLYSIDAWTDMDGNAMEETLELCSSALDEFGNGSVMKKALSEEAAADFEDGTFDFIYIDADHRYEPALRDMRLWLPKVKSGGVLAGHDYSSRGKGITKGVATEKHPDRGRKGVKRAVNDFVKEMGLELRVTREPCPSWWVVRP